jgi:HAD superfamily hydrolase (TIGR01450 family)
MLDHYDTLLFDLDGTLFRGSKVIPGAPEAVDAAHRAGNRVRYITNNASRSPAEVAGHLTDLGIPARAAEVSTSAQAGAAVLAGKLDAGATVLVVGSPGLVAELEAVGLRAVREAGDEVVAVVQGLSKDTSWRDLAEACLAIRAGALWVACNVDPMLPTERGLLPGNGSLVAALRTATGAEPVVAGKPATPLFVEATRGAEKALVVGDRLDTDIAGAINAGLDSLLVLSGGNTAADVYAADDRPTYIAADVAGLTEPADRLRVAPQPGWRLEGDVVHGDGDPLALLRTLCATPPRDTLVAGDDTARAALDHLDIRHELA